MRNVRPTADAPYAYSRCPRPTSIVRAARRARPPRATTPTTATPMVPGWRRMLTLLLADRAGAPPEAGRNSRPPREALTILPSVLPCETKRGVTRLSSTNREVERGVRPAQRSLGGRRALAAREDEAEIRGALGEWHHALPLMHRDGDVLDARHRARGLQPRHAFENPGAWNGDHHHPRRGACPLEGSHGPAEGMADDDLFEGHAGAEAEGARAQAADGARGQLDEPGTRFVDSELDVDRPVREAEGLRRLARARDDGRLGRLGQPRRRHIDGFLEKGSIERIRLVEDGQGTEAALRQEALQRDLDTGD